MDVCLVIKRRLEELRLEQKDLATAAELTDSYISQLLARNKLRPAPVAGEWLRGADFSVIALRK